MQKALGSKFVHYGTALLAVLVAHVITQQIQQIDKQPTLFLFLGAVIISTLVGGLLPGLLSLGAAALITAYFVMAPQHSFSIVGSGAVVRWVLFQALGLSMVILLASRRAVAERLLETDQRLRMALDAGRIGVWDYSLTSGQLWVSSELGTLFGQDPKWFRPSFSEFLGYIHSEDREFFHQAVLRTITDRVDYEVDFRVVRPDGSIRWLVSRGRGYQTGGAQRIVGVISENATNRSTTVAARAVKSDSTNFLTGQKL